MDNKNVFTINATITFQPFRIPPRCRKPRRISETFTHEFSVPSVTEAEAPIAAWIPTYDSDTDIPLRVHNGQLLRADTGTCNPAGVPIGAGSDDFPANVSVTDSWFTTEYEAVAELEDRYRETVIVDGGVWVRAEEPAYVIQHLGMGRNHGGTHLEVVSSGADRFNPRNRFSILEHDLAVERAVAAAAEVGDDKSFERIRRTPKATILDPTAFKMPTWEKRLATAKRELNALLDIAYGFQLGAAVTRYNLASAAQYLQSALDHMHKHGLESISRN